MLRASLVPPQCQPWASNWHEDPAARGLRLWGKRTGFIHHLSSSTLSKQLNLRVPQRHHL